MKTISTLFVIVYVLIGMNSFAQSDPPENLFILGSGFGYNFSLAGGNLGADVSPDNISGIYGSRGEGLVIDLEFGMKIYQNLFAMLSLNYLNGRTIESSTFFTNETLSYTQNETNHLRVPLIIDVGGRYFIESSSFSSTGNERSLASRFVPYLGMGCGIALAGRMTSTLFKETVHTTIQTWDIKSLTTFNPAFVIYGEAGLKLIISNRISVFTGIKFTSFSLMMSKKTIQSYVFNGEDKTSELTTAEREIEYVRSWDQQGSQDPDEPVKQLAQQYPSSGLSVKCGILFAIGHRGTPSKKIRKSD